MCSPSTALKVNCLVIRYLYFGSVRGDLQEGHVYDKRLCGCASRCQFPLFPVPIPVFSSTKSAFLCAFSLRNPHFQGFRAQNRGFCALLALETLIFGVFEHKIRVFVRFWSLEPLFSGISSTKLGFLCACYGNTGLWKQKSAQIFCFCALLIYYSGVTAGAGYFTSS